MDKFKAKFFSSPSAFLFGHIIRYWRAKIKKYFKRKKFVYGTTKTKEQMKNELLELRSRRVKKQLKTREYEKQADDTLYKMLDVANLAIISATLNWCLGRIDKSPVDLMTISIKKRRKAKEQGRENILTRWLEDKNIDKSYLEAIIKKVADGEVEKT